MATVDKLSYGTLLWVENIDQADPYPWITFLGPDKDLDLSFFPALSSAISEGTILPEADYGITQQTATFTEGTITASGGTGPTITSVPTYPPGFRNIRCGGTYT
jgi:hypothetical protein